MQLRNPLALYIGLVALVLFVVVAMLKKFKGLRYKPEKSVANTDRVRQTSYFRTLQTLYNFGLAAVQVLCIIAMIISVVMISRPSELSVRSTELGKRDIMLCMDVSLSMDELNIELVTKLQDIVKGLEGERFGISIFNSSEVLVLPLTDDYNYTISELEKIRDSLVAVSSYNYDSFEVRNYVINGTTLGGDERGGSLVGDGLASCTYHFSDMDEDRTRVIILSTDNDINGTPILTFEEAIGICNRDNIKVYGVGIDGMSSQDENEMKSLVESTGGNFYKYTDENSSDSIVNDIMQLETKEVEGEKEIILTDKPEALFIVLMLSTIIMINIGSIIKIQHR